MIYLSLEILLLLSTSRVVPSAVVVLLATLKILNENNKTVIKEVAKITNIK